MKEYCGQLKDKEFNIEVKKSHHKKNGVYKINKYCNDILTFDIETTSAWLDEKGKVIGYKIGKTNEYWNSLKPLSLCYIWQFGFNDEIYYGRELRDFIKVLDDLPKDKDFIIWVHNLSFEFAFLTSILEVAVAFARSPHKPMKVIFKEYPNIEFRCSYMLTRLSLESWGEQLGVPKAIGDLDYEKIRTPLTKLNDIEMNYCKQDCIVVYNGIKKYLEEYKVVRNIPLTQTGTVRRVCKELLMKDPMYRKKIRRLIPSTYTYTLLQDVFSGGYTHANRIHSGEVLDGIIEHYDFSSSYPTVMIAEKYPMSPWIYIGNEFPNEDTFDNYAYIFEIEFSKINSVSYNTYIQASKSTFKNAIKDNGRIISADNLKMKMTEQDYIIISNNYEWESMKVNYVYRSRKEYLPKQFVEYILDLYKNKTSLKDVEGFEDLYMQSKQYINSLFGMTVTSIVQSEIRYSNDGRWIINPLTKEYVNNYLYKLSTYNSKKYFLSFSWGVYVTAYARRNLWKCMEKCGNMGYDVAYCDTDSIFCIGEHDYSWYNEEITEKLKKACEFHNIDFERTRPKTPKGKPKPLGIFDKEDNCIQFITLGAKRYCERREDGNLYMTVSGINKSSVAMLDNDIYNFKDNFNFDKDNPNVKKRLCTYVNNQPIVTYPDGYISTYKNGINLRRTGYLLSITDEYKDLIHYENYNPMDMMTDSVINIVRGRFNE